MTIKSHGDTKDGLETRKEERGNTGELLSPSTPVGRPDRTTKAVPMFSVGKGGEHEALRLSLFVCWLGRIYADNCTCCHTEVQVADQTFYLTWSQCTHTGPTSPSTDPITPGTWQSSHWSANFSVPGMTRPGKVPSQAGFELRTFRFRGGRLNHLASETV